SFTAWKFNELFVTFCHGEVSFILRVSYLDDKELKDFAQSFSEISGLEHMPGNLLLAGSAAENP
ncbi:MAG: hypothetical protein ABIK83_13265, partial [Candidatus Zixiibacteriota bacterium]